jgi:hypothetical protein
MSARSRAFPWWGARKVPRPWPPPEILEFRPPLPATLFGYPIEYIDPSILDPASLAAYQWREEIVFGRVRFRS